MTQITMSLPDAVKSCLRKYFSFRGRATRAEYWWFSIFVSLLSFSIMMIVDRNVSEEVSDTVFVILDFFFFFPLWAVSVRRLHDTNRSGWWLLLTASIIGVPVLFLFLCFPSNMRTNDFGAVPCLVNSPHTFGEEKVKKKRPVYSADSMEIFDRHGE